MGHDYGAWKRWAKANPEKLKALAKRRYERSKAKGRCVLCPNPVVPGYVNCAAHKRSQADSAMRRNSGASREWFDAAVIFQNGRCAICCIPSDALQVDHDHDTGLPRALLCTTCNTGIGHLRDDPELVARALAYLLEHRQVKEVAS